MINPPTRTKFLVRLNGPASRGTHYVLRIDKTPIQTTTNRKLALMMGKFTAEEVVKSLTTVRCNPELLSVEVPA